MPQRFWVRIIYIFDRSKLSSLFGGGPNDDGGNESLMYQSHKPPTKTKKGKLLWFIHFKFQLNSFHTVLVFLISYTFFKLFWL